MRSAMKAAPALYLQQLPFVLTCSCLLAALLQHVPACSHGFLQNHARVRNTRLRFLQQDSPLSMQQTLDHFNPQDERKFQQRYYELLDNFVDPHGPIFLEVCGEAECIGIGDSFYLALAEEMNAAYVTLEHRYYGESIPTRDLSTKSLKYLSTGQALFDLANFRNFYQLGESLGPECGPLYMEITRRLEKGLRENATHIKSLFNAEEKSDGEFAQFMASVPAQYTQYGGQNVPCKPILHAFHKGRDLLEAYVDAFSSLYESLDEFLETRVQNKGYDDGDRQWNYQQCSELGFFTTAASKNNIFMHSLNLKYWLEFCASAFGNGTYPNTKLTNLNYGATRISGSRILFINGSQDPWRHASKNTSTSSEESVLITCSNCAHCVDISGCYPFDGSRGDPRSCSSPENVTIARNIMRKSIKSWIASNY